MKLLKAITPLLLSVGALLGLVVTRCTQETMATTIGLSLIGISGIVVLYVRWLREKKLIQEALSAMTLKDKKKDNLSLEDYIHQNTRKLETAARHIRQLGNIKDQFTIDPLLAEEEIGHALKSVQSEMKKLKEEEDHQHWITEGLAKFGEILRTKGEVKEYSARIISNLVKYVGANQGALFLEGEDESQRYMELTACYAYDKNKTLEKRIYEGQGLLGQCMYEKEMVFLTDIPKDYVSITSGLGLATPRNLIVLPLLINEQFYGVIELALFRVLQPHEVDFLQKVSLTIASEVGAIRTLDHTRGLLAESGELSRQLQAHEEEMRMNMEELAATQEEMKRHHSELEKKQVELRSYLSAIDNTIASVEFDMHGKITAANNMFLKITDYTLADIIDRSYTDLLYDDESMRMMWQNLKDGKFFSGEFRMKSRGSKEQWINGTLNPIFDLQGKPYKIMLFAQFTTKEKEKFNDLSATLQAFKTAIPMVEFNDSFQCKTANDRFLKMFGVSRIELRNKKLSDFMTEEYFNETFKTLYGEILKNESLSIIGSFKLDNQQKQYEISISILRDLTGNVSRIVMLLIHELKENVVSVAV